MTGRVVCFRPRLRRGIVRAEGGDELAFETDGATEAIQGDDLVEFVVVGQGSHRVARVTRILETPVSRCVQYEQLLHELFGAVDTERTSAT